MEDESKFYWHDLQNLGFTKDELNRISDYKKLNGFVTVDDLVKYVLLEVVEKRSSTGIYQDVIQLLSLALRYPEQSKVLVTAALEVLQP